MTHTHSMIEDGLFAGRTALVTGGGTGLGLAVSTRLGRLGANIVCVSRDVDHHEELTSRGREQGFEAMTRSLAAEWAEFNIRVNAVSPGPFVSTGAAARLWPSAELEETVRRQIPLGRFGTAEEVAELVCLLASPATPWITGAVWLADGGWTLPEAMVDIDPEMLKRHRSAES